jgi:flagellar biosynthetic protein FliR
MENLLDLSGSDLTLFLLAFFRVAGIVMVAPVFGSPLVPPVVRVFLALLLAVLFFPFVGRPGAPPPGLGGAALAVLGEAGVGLLIGFAASLLFTAVQMGGRLVDREIGLQVADLFDPLTNEPASILGPFKVFLATVVYLLIDGHHLLLAAVSDSFRAVPLLGVRLGEGAVLHVSDTLTRDLFRAAVQIAAPALVTLFLVTVALAFMARTVPEMNVFLLSFSVRVLVGLAVLAAGVGLFVTVFHDMTVRHSAAVRALTGLLGG